MSYALLYEGQLVKGRMPLDETNELDALQAAIRKARKLERTCPGVYFLERPDASLQPLTRYLRDPYYSQI
jgi:hypothetical protein